MPSKKTIIGTGLSGMVGSRFTEFYKDNFNFINLDLTTGTNITNQDQVEKILSKYSPTTLIHLAAFTDVSKAHQQTDDKSGLAYQVNVLGTKNISKACKKYGHYLIHISTDFVFDGKKNSKYTEEDIPSPIEWYGKTKYLAEREVINSGVNHAIVRIAFPFRSKFPGKLDLIRNIINKLKTNSLYPMFSDQVITPTFTDDICQVLKEFISKKPIGIYHAVGSTSISPFDLAKKISQVFNIRADIKEGSFKDFMKKDPRSRQQYLKISNDKLKKDLGLTMKTLDQALEVLKSQLN
ncbi:MAG: SDR family oxidoreductase [Patescibacteria group bacterium]